MKLCYRRVCGRSYSEYRTISRTLRPLVHSHQHEGHHQIPDSWSPEPTEGWKMVRLEHECCRKWYENIASVRFLDSLGSPPCTLTIVMDRQAWGRLSQLRLCPNTTDDRSTRWVIVLPLLASEANDPGLCWRTQFRRGELDPQLTNIFRVAGAWNAILLVDEADVFLQRRAELSLPRRSCFLSSPAPQRP